MVSQQSAQESQPSLAISPSVIVGIVILAAFAVLIVFASVFRYCRRNRSVSTGGDAEEGGTDTFNPNRPRSAGQNARMLEVRRINNMYAWERGRHARMEIGEMRPTTMILGRSGQSRNWDEYTIADEDSGRAMIPNPFDEQNNASYLYNIDDPYARSSKQQLSHLAPPVSARNSYQTCSDYNPRHQSVLLPQPIQREPVPRSSLRNEFCARYLEGEGEKEGSPSSSARNPKITINDCTQDITKSRLPTTEGKFEVIPLDDDDDKEGDDYRMQSNFAATSPNQPFPELPAMIPSQSFNSISVYDDGDSVNSGYRPTDNRGVLSSSEERAAELPPREGVKGIIQEWERMNGRFARMY